MAYLRFCLECFQGPSYTATASYAHLEDHFNRVKLDNTNMGTNVVLMKNGHRICGSGAALGNTVIVQNKAYFEVKIQQQGLWGAGLALLGVNLDKTPLGEDENSWVLRQDGKLWTDGRAVAELDHPIEEGDVFGFAYDHLDLTLFKNGEPTNCTMSRFRGHVFPAVFVDDGAILDVQFSSFWFIPPKDFDEILIEKTIL